MNNLATRCQNQKILNQVSLRLMPHSPFSLLFQMAMKRYVGVERNGNAQSSDGKLLICLSVTNRCVMVKVGRSPRLRYLCGCDGICL